MSDKKTDGSRNAIVDKIFDMAKKAEQTTNWTKEIENYRTPLSQGIMQPKGSGTQILVAIHPTSPMAKRLLAEMEWRYHCTAEFDRNTPLPIGTSHSRERALVGYLRKLPWIGDSARFVDGDRGPEVWSPNAIVDLDFVIVNPKNGACHLERFTDRNVAYICRQLGIAFYQCTKRKDTPDSNSSISFPGITLDKVEMVLSQSKK